MKAVIKAGAPAALKTPALIVFLSAEDQPSLPGRPELAGLAGLIGPRLKQGDFKAKHLEALVLFPEGKKGPERIILVGMGPAKEIDPAKIRQASAKGVQAARELGLDSAAVLMPAIPGAADPQAAAETVMLGAFLGGYDFDELKTKEEDKKKPLRSLTLVRTGTMSYPAASYGVSTGKSRLKGEASFGELKPPF
ncbi:MAG: M17 family peptidase N-terminal domain-containing protein, partial [Pseudomonadota bacterium]